MQIRDEIIGAILGHEGGYVNDPSDSGGETNWGITRRVARQHGYMGPMRDLPKERAIEIYVVLYWNRLNLDEIARYSHNLAYILFDLGVNAGTRRAGRYLQRCLNVLNNRARYWPDLIVDGDVGGLTLRVFRAYDHKRGQKGMRVICAMIKSLQMVHYITLSERREKDEKFMYGWAVRALNEDAPGVMTA